MQTIYYLVISLIMILTSNIIYATNYIISPNMDIKLEFKPQKEKFLENPLFWSVSLQCELASQIKAIPFSTYAIKKSASLNGYKIKEGKVLYATLETNKIHLIEVDGLAKISLINMEQS